MVKLLVNLKFCLEIFIRSKWVRARVRARVRVRVRVRVKVILGKVL